MAQLQKLRERRDDLPDLEKVVLFDGAGDCNWVLSLGDVEALGTRHLQQQQKDLIDSFYFLTPTHGRLAVAALLFRARSRMNHP